MTSITTKRMKTGNYETVFCEGGSRSNKTIIFLHGGGVGVTGESNWADILPVFSEQYHVLAPDLVGFGRTDHPEEPPKSLMAWMRQRVDQVLSMMDGLGIEKASLVGNSMGGLASLNLVSTSPERFESVVLMGSPGGVSSPTPEVYRLTNFYKDPTEASLRNLFKWFVYDESVLGERLDEIVRSRFEEAMRPEVRKSYEAIGAGITPGDMVFPTSALRRMNIPFFLVHGLNDRFASLDSSLDMLKHLPNVQLHVFDRCGHWVQVEKKEEFCKLVMDFFNREF